MLANVSHKHRANTTRGEFKGEGSFFVFWFADNNLFLTISEGTWILPFDSNCALL